MADTEFDPSEVPGTAEYDHRADSARNNEPRKATAAEERGIAATVKAEAADDAEKADDAGKEKT
jgi:hypothetical protein